MAAGSDLSASCQRSGERRSHWTPGTERNSGSSREWPPHAEAGAQRLRLGLWGSTVEGPLCPWSIRSRPPISRRRREQREPGLLVRGTMYLTNCIFMTKLMTLRGQGAKDVGWSARRNESQRVLRPVPSASEETWG